MTYTVCPICHATGSIPKPSSQDRTPCPCLRSKSPGYAPTGLTLGQIERLVLTERCLSGDPGVPAGERWGELVKLRERLEVAIQREDFKWS